MLTIVLALALARAPVVKLPDPTPEALDRCVAEHNKIHDAQEDAQTRRWCKRKLKRDLKQCGGDLECCEAWNKLHGLPADAPCDPY